MALDYDQLMTLAPIETVQDVTVRDTILYALGVGVGAQDPTDLAELRYTYEAGLQALPTMAAVLAHPGFWARDPKLGLDWTKILHAEQSIELHGRLPVEGRVRGVTRVDEVYDKGAAKGAILHTSREISDERSGELLATAREIMFLRGDGGRGGAAEGAPKPRPVPERAADLTVVAKTQVDQALLYRLSGDYNPLHVDPRAARDAGFEKPILHGHATFGVVGRALLKAVAGDDPARFKRMEVRFSNIVYPGETLAIDIWNEGAGRFAFRATAAERGAAALQNGWLEVAGA